MELLNASLLQWSRAQFAMTTMFHWIFVPLTLGLGIIMAVMETQYVRTGDEAWKNAAKFWMRLFGINFVFGVATGLVLEFEFGTNWSNYSWFVGDIFGAPLAIEATVAFFLEATFITLMFFGWNKISKKAHLTATWLTVFGATISALWILIANAWMQFPVGMEFNPDTIRNEMVDFRSIIFSPVAINKFFHAVLSGWVLGALFVVGVSAWFIIRKRQVDFARKSMKLGAVFGIISSILIIVTGHVSAFNVAHHQPMKLAAMEGLYKGQEGTELILFGIVNPEKEAYDDDTQSVIAKIAFPKMLSFLGYSNFNAFVPGIQDIINGGYEMPNGDIALSFEEKKERGKAAIQALTDYQSAKENNNDREAAIHRATLKDNYFYFGYGYLEHPEEIIPNIPLTFYSFHIMVILGFYFILLFVVVWFLFYKKKIEDYKWFLWICVLSIPLGYVVGEAGWIVAELGRQPWAIQDVLPVQAALSSISVESVKLTLFIFLALFTALLVAEIRIMLNQIKKGPDE